MKEVINYDSEACGFAQSKFSMRSRSIHFGPGIHPDSSSYQIYPKVTRLARAWLLAIVVVMHAATVHVRVLSTNCTVFLRHFRDDLFFLFF